MKGIFVFGLIAVLLLAGCAYKDAAETDGEKNGFTLASGEKLAKDNETSANGSGKTNETQDTKPVTSGSGGQIVDVGQSVPLGPGQ
jgi:hypothetical protein